MVPLPKERLDSYNPPFTHTAVDYFRPMAVGLKRNRTGKRYGALFTCLVTRAVYLDLAISLSSEDFLLVLRRFIALHGRPATMNSGNGTNFVGAERELREALQTTSLDEDIHQKCQVEGIKWKFQPPAAPHFGGAHERLVRSTKTALYRALALENNHHQQPTEEVLRTLLFEVNGLLNGRPLTYVSSDPKDLRPITPNDLLNRPSSTDTPNGDFTSALPREHYHYVQRVTNLFWDQWRKCYLPSLIARKRWQHKQRNFEVGDTVLVADPNQPRRSWNKGKIIETYPSDSDKLVRAVKV